MTAVFLDTVGLLAVWDSADQWHVDAANAYLVLQNDGRPLVTTDWVLMECGNAAARRPYRSRVQVLRQLLIQESALISITEDDLSAAWTAYDAGYANQAGIVDQVSFVAMNKQGITEAFTNDRHFKAAGFTTLF